MTRHILILAGSAVALLACGGRMEQLRQNAEALRQVVGTGERAQEADHLSAERSARGDTLPASADRLSLVLPGTVEGYLPSEAVEKDVVDGGATRTRRSWTSLDGATTLNASVVDHGNADAAARAGAAPYLDVEPHEDDTSVVKEMENLPENSAGSVVFNRQNGSTRATVGVRFRYTVTLETSGSANTSDMLSELASTIARRLEENDR